MPTCVEEDTAKRLLNLLTVNSCSLARILHNSPLCVIHASDRAFTILRSYASKVSLRRQLRLSCQGKKNLRGTGSRTKELVRKKARSFEWA
jgi:hypothetical protein